MQVDQVSACKNIDIILKGGSVLRAIEKRSSIQPFAFDQLSKYVCYVFAN